MSQNRTFNSDGLENLFIAPLLWNKYKFSWELHNCLSFRNRMVLSLWKEDWYRGRVTGCWTWSRPVRQSLKNPNREMEAKPGAGSAFDGGDMRHEKFGGWVGGCARSWREAGVWGGDKNYVAATSRACTHASIHTHTHTHACTHKGINTLLQMPLAETARSTSNIKLKWRSFKCLHCCSPRPCTMRNTHKERAEWFGK